MTSDAPEQLGPKEVGWPPLRATGQKPMGVGEDSLKQIFLTPEGKEVTSQFDIGPEAHHQRIFIEYERTFGRGKAFAATHNDEYHESLLAEYQTLAASAQRMMLTATGEQAATFIQALSDFRSRHPELYSDVNTPRKKFKIRGLE